MTYEAYIQSSIWQKKRKERIALDNNKCRLCDEDGSISHLEVHHRPSSYQHIPNESVKNDLITLCKVCHDLITNRIRERRYGNKQVKTQYHNKSILDRENNNVEIESISLDIRFASNPAQRTTSRPDTPSNSTIQEDIWQEKQNPRRS